MGHHVDRVRLHFGTILVLTPCGDGVHHRLGDLVVTLRPGIDDFVVLFTLSDQAVHVLLFKVLHLIARLIDQFPLVVGNDHVVFAERDARLERFDKTQAHDLVAEDDRLFLTAIAVDRVDDGLHVALTQQAVDQFKRRLCIQRQKLTKPHAAGCRFTQLPDFAAFLVNLLDAAFDLGMQVHFARVERVLNLFGRGKDHAFTFHAVPRDGHIVQTKDHILRGNNDRCAVGRRQNVVRRHHQDTRFQLGFKAQRDVHGHLVAVKVSVESRADQRVQLDRLAFDQDRLKRLNAQTVQRGRAV